MPRYLPSQGHIFLSEEAQLLDMPSLEIHADVAERLLGLVGTDFQGVQEATAISAVARQISVQVSMVPELAVLESASRGSRSESYRDLDAMVAIDPLAKQIVDSLFDERDRPTVEDQSRYESVRSVRGRGVASYWRHGEEGIQP